MPFFSFLSELRCSRCDRAYPVDRPVQMCSCGAPLLARYDFATARRAWNKASLVDRPRTLWRYHELLPVVDPRFVVTFQEPMTPIVPLARTGRDWDMAELSVKDESVLPTGTFKARGATVGISKAQELGVTDIVIPTNGNAGAAWAAYGARAGIPVTAIVPEAAPVIPRRECSFLGAHVRQLPGTIAQAGELSSEMAMARGVYDVATLREPYRLEGKKTMGFEIAEQFGWRLPDVIVYPTGGGAGVIGIYKAFQELRQLGWIEGDLPRMVAVQAAGCAPLAEAFSSGATESDMWPQPRTIAFGITVPKALGDFLILEAIRATGGTVAVVSDEEIAREWRAVARREGLQMCPEGAAALAGLHKLRRAGWIRAKDCVLVMNTGSVLKYLNLPEAFADIRDDVQAVARE